MKFGVLVRSDSMSNIVQNLKKAIEAIEGRDSSELELSCFTSKGECGTLYCSAGILAITQYFYDQGMMFKEDHVYINGRSMFQAEVGDIMFGTCAYSRLFELRGCAEWDGEIDPRDEMTDKELALARLNRQLEVVQKELSLAPD
jgi:hypothetical protein